MANQIQQIWETLKDTNAAGSWMVTLWDLQQEMVRKTGKRADNRAIEDLYKVGLRLRPASHLGDLEDWQADYCIPGMNETLAYLVQE